MQVLKKSESKLLGRTYVELAIDDKAGTISRRGAVEAAAKELGVEADRIGLVGLEGQSGATAVVGKLYVYESADAKKKMHQRHLQERMLTNEEREKLKQDRKKAAAPAQAPAAEAKK